VTAKKMGHASRLDAQASDPLRLPPQAPSTLTVPAVDKWSYFQNGTFLADADRDINVMTNGRHWVDVVHTPAVARTASDLGVDTLSRQQLFKLALDTLLVPRRNVVTAARGVLAQVASASKQKLRHRSPFYVGVQIRCGSHGRLTWYDPTRHSLQDVPCFVAQAVRACGGRPICPIFLTADSRTAADAFRSELLKQPHSQQRYAVIEADGPILHTDRTNASTAAATGAADPWLRSVVDWWLLKHASSLVISRSGFGETAAWASARGAPARRIELGVPGACNVTAFDAASAF